MSLSGFRSFGLWSLRCLLGQEPAINASLGHDGHDGQLKQPG